MNNKRKEQLIREQYGLTQSERILDHQLFKKTKVRSHNNQGQKLEQVEKQIYGDQNKKVKVEASQGQLTCHQALEQVLKYLNNPNKTLIVLKKIKQLFLEFKEKFYQLHQLQILYQLSQIKCEIKEHDCNTELQEIFEICKNTKYTSTTEIFNIQFNIRISLQSDDTYQFNDVLKKFKAIIQDLNTQTLEQIPDIKAENQKQCIEHYNYEILPEFEKFMNEDQLGFKQVCILNCLEVLVNQFKFQWAKSSIHTFIQHLNFEQKQLFSPEFHSRIDNIISRIQNAKILYNANTERDAVKNAQIMQDYLKPNHDVVDSRSTINTGDGLDQWHLKQSGL